ncbi:MraY family glycosyltransferase [Sediminibacillus albus]|uniref:UDP-GlcNAc:undecaprenyl-phosphate GlcNAc-1-phosphate transferase n=1 Tax=Sediminibacillus albus TaxID=407036 RepID=A0A1G8ZHJ0_9BACI|nr:MraY family glycosyltransferase [Sediminibacillus albus]SDK14508.1 UDP-GlcNAc:undecaprenyl-phosphate GlcNAc-1-phosphate transferase [Sediminibacillus albus]
MVNVTELVIAFFISLISTVLLVFPVKQFAVKIGAIDQPEARKIHTVAIPRLGGLAIFLGTVLGLLYLQPVHMHMFEIVTGAVIVILLGILDDKLQLRPVFKLAGQIAAAAILINGGLIIERINVPLLGLVELEGWSTIITLLWIVGITNAINLIDGLDGLASGVSTIALISVLIMALGDYRIVVVYFCVVLIASNLGFLFHNFYPAKIYMGDTGSMFLGYSVAVISLLGLFKNVTLFSFIIPVIVLAVPIFDTLFAIVRRLYNRENIMLPDKKHIHYQLLAAGFSHRTTVLIIYGFSAVFGTLGILFSNASLSISLVISFVILLLLVLIAELGAIEKGKKPLINSVHKLVKRANDRG